MGVYAVATKTDLDSISVAESNYTPDMLGAFSIIAESDKTYNDIMKAIGLAELACLESTGAEIVYEAADSESFFEKIKKWFINLGQKIAALFKNFINKVRDWATNDTKFAEKYEKALKDADVSKLDYNGYVFSNLFDTNSGTVYLKTAEVLINKFGTGATYAEMKADTNNELATKLNDESVDVEEVANKIRGAAIGKDSIESKDFDKEIYKHFRSNEDKPVKLTNIKIADIINDIKETKRYERAVKIAYDSLNATLKGEIKDLDDLKASVKRQANNAENDADKEKNNARIAAISKVTNYTRIRMNIITAVNGGLLSAIAANRAQAKSICVELLKANKKKEDAKTEEPKAEEPVNASAKFEHTTNYLNKVVLK